MRYVEGTGRGESVEELLTVGDVCKRLKMHQDTVREYLRDGRLKGIKIGRRWRVKEKDLQEFISNP